MSLANLSPKPKTERALLATDFGGLPVVLATDGSGIAALVREFGIYAEEFGLVHSSDCPTPGLYLFTGYSTLELETWESLYPTETVWHGEVRKVEPHELAELYAMKPPPMCAMCDRDATSEANEMHWCGRAECVVAGTEQGESQ